MLKRLDESHFYDVKVVRNASLDCELTRVGTISTSLKRSTIIRFFEKNHEHMLDVKALKKLRLILDNSMTVMKKNNLDAQYGVWVHDLLYVFAQQSPNRRSIDSVQMYLRDEHAQNNCRVLYNLVSGIFSAPLNDEILESDDESFEFDECSDIELSE